MVADTSAVDLQHGEKREEVRCGRGEERKYLLGMPAVSGKFEALWLPQLT